MTHFHTALVNGDLGFIQLIIESLSNDLEEIEIDLLSAEGKSKRINDTNLSMCDQVNKKKEVYTPERKFFFYFPLSLAATSSNLDLFQYLLASGVDIHLRGEEGNTIVHSLAKLSNSKPEISIQILNALVSVMPAQERHLLIKSDNNANVSPLDMAAEIG